MIVLVGLQKVLQAFQENKPPTGFQSINFDLI